MSLNLTQPGAETAQHDASAARAAVLSLRGIGTVLVVAAVTFWLAYDNGTFTVPSRSAAGIVVWWAIVVGLATRMLPRSRPTRIAWVVFGALCAYTAVATASIAWGAAPEHAFDELNRLALYGGVFAFVVLAAVPKDIGRWCDGIALGLSAVAALALSSRLLPQVVRAAGYQNLALIPLGARRLSYPVGYWNGLGVLIALSVPLLLRAAVSHPSHVARALAAFPFPILSAAMYLTSSRTAAVVTAVAVILFVVLHPRRSATLAVLAAVAPGSVAAVKLLTSHPVLVDGPFGSASAVHAGRLAAAIIVVLCLGTASIVLVGSILAARLRVDRRVERLLLVPIAAAVVAGLVAVHPVSRLHAFTKPPATFASSNYVQTHLLSANGNGRWQLWQTAADEWLTRPLLGRGLGTYQAWQTQHGRLGVFVHDAHSLYLQTLAELGLVGLAAIVIAFGGGVVAAVRAVATRRDEDASAVALTAAWVAYVLAVGMDWMWQLPVVSIVGLAVLALLVALGGSRSPQPEFGASARVGAGARRLTLGLAVVLAVLLAWSQLSETGSVRALAASQAAAGADDLATAARKAHDAATLEPWAASPYLQLALVDEQRRRLATAGGWIQLALRRDPLNWQLWAVSSRIAYESGRIADARRALVRAHQLNPAVGSLGR